MVATSGDRLSESAEAALRPPAAGGPRHPEPGRAGRAARPPAADWAGALEQAAAGGAWSACWCWSRAATCAGEHPDGEPGQRSQDDDGPDALVGPDGVLPDGEDPRRARGHAQHARDRMLALQRAGDAVRPGPGTGRGRWCWPSRGCTGRWRPRTASRSAAGTAGAPLRGAVVRAGVPRRGAASLDTWWNGIADLRDIHRRAGLHPRAAGRDPGAGGLRTLPGAGRPVPADVRAGAVATPRRWRRTWARTVSGPAPTAAWSAS